MEKIKNVKNIIILILSILVIIFTILNIVRKYNKEKEESQMSVQDKYEVDTILDKEMIYKEVVTEITEGKEEYVTHSEEAERVNTSNEMKKSVEVTGAEGLIVEGLEISAKNDISAIKGKLKNTTSKEMGDFIIYISIIGKEGKQIIELGAYINKVAANETVEFTTSTSIDIANAYKYTVTKK